MHKLKFHTKEIYKDLCEQIQVAVGSDIKVYGGNRPIASKNQHNEMIVVNTPLGFKDHNVYQDGTYRIEVIVKNDSQGLIPIGRLDEITNMIVDLFPINGKDGRYFCKDPKLITTGHDGMGWSIWALQATLIVNTTDAYTTQENN